MRWMAFMGRTGTVLLMIGLALVFVSLIPPHSPSRGSSRGSIAPQQYSITDSRVYTPQTGFRVSVESSDSVQVFFLGLRQPEYDNWRTQLADVYFDSPQMRDFYTVPLVFLMEAYPDLDDIRLIDIMDIMFDVAVLDKGLETHSEVIVWESPPSTAVSHEFFPTEVLHVTVIVANRSPDTVELETERVDSKMLAPKERLVLPARLLISAGIALTIVWLVWKRAKKRAR